MDLSTMNSLETSKLAKAMLAVQRDMQPATKDATNPFCKNKYATLNSVMDACRPVLNQHGIWLTQLPMPAPDSLGPGHIGLLTKLTHVESGQWQSSFAVAPLPKDDPQGMGSALTYLRRYALTAMLGMTTEDDDGNAASNPQNTLSPAIQPTKAPRTQKTTSGKQSQNGLNHPEFDFDSLPQLDGVEYQIVTGNDGRDCVLALGNTFAKKEILQGAGFKWSQERKCWWRYGNAA